MEMEIELHEGHHKQAHPPAKCELTGTSTEYMFSLSWSVQASGFCNMSSRFL